MFFLDNTFVIEFLTLKKNILDCLFHAQPRPYQFPFLFKCNLLGLSLHSLPSYTNDFFSDFFLTLKKTSPRLEFLDLFHLTLQSDCYPIICSFPLKKLFTNAIEYIKESDLIHFSTLKLNTLMLDCNVIPHRALIHLQPINLKSIFF